jgi:hypothetical protein
VKRDAVAAIEFTRGCPYTEGVLIDAAPRRIGFPGAEQIGAVMTRLQEFALVIEEYLLHNYPHGKRLGGPGHGRGGARGLMLAILAFAFGRPTGRLETCWLLTAVLSAGLSMLLFPEHRLIEQQLAEIAFWGLAGAHRRLRRGAGSPRPPVGSWRSYTALGYSLLGLWLLILNLSARMRSSSRSVQCCGHLRGAVMSLGLAAIPGVLGRSSVEESASWISRVIGRAGYLGWQVLFPLWCIWLGVSRLPF